MKEYRDIINHIFCKNKNYDDMVEYKEVMEEIMEDMEKHYPALYKEIISKLEKIAYSIPLDKAKEKVTSMKPFGEHWTYEGVKDFIESKGIYGKCIEYYLVMNMSYNDYYDVATNFGHQGDAEFYFELANAFINDIDGDKYKVEKYFMN